MTLAGRPLAGRNVLVTRNPGEWPSLQERLDALGAVSTFRSPTRQEEPRDADAVDATVDRLAEFRWLVFTSGNGVRFFADAVRRRGRLPSAVAARLAAVGPATARAVSEAFGRAPDVVSHAGHGRALARDLSASADPGARILVVRPETAAGGLDQALRRAGMPFDQVVVYRTVPAPWAADVAASIAGDHHDVVVFTAPSTARAILDAGGALRERVERGLGKARRVALGPTTAHALQDAGFPAHAVAASPTEEAVAEAVIAAVSAGPGSRSVC